MMGMDQAGVAEVIDFVLKKFSPEDQTKLAQVSLDLCLDSDALCKLTHKVLRFYLSLRCFLIP